MPIAAQDVRQHRGVAGTFSELDNDLDYRGSHGCFLVRVKGFGGWVESGRWCGWGVGEVGDAELDRVGATGADLVDLGEFLLGAGEADLEALGLAVPAVGFGFGDAGEEVVADLLRRGWTARS